MRKIDYSCKKFQADAMYKRWEMGLEIKCYPSRYKFKKSLEAVFWWELREGCMKCGKNEKLEFDHIKPESKYPELALDEDNIQILCRSCNASKGNRNENNYMPKEKTRQEIFDEMWGALK